jgi:putative transposase
VIGNSLSSYTQAINRQNNTFGSLFQKKTKAKCLTDLPIGISGFSPTDYLLTCFHYIHLNPLKAKLVNRLEDWPHSSWPGYVNLRDDHLCSKEKALAVLGLPDLSAQTYILNEDVLQSIW